MVYELIFGVSGRVVGSTIWTVGGPAPGVSGLTYVTTDATLGEVDPASLVATIEDGQVVGVAIDPEYTPPAPPADQTQVRLAALQAAVDLIPLNTIHNRRWIAQKTRAKTVGIAYIKTNPGADQATVSAAVLADLEAEFPMSAELGPVVVCPGILMSYAKSAAAAGFIAEATFENLRALIVASSNDDLVQMLAVL